MHSVSRDSIGLVVILSRDSFNNLDNLTETPPEERPRNNTTGAMSQWEPTCRSRRKRSLSSFSLVRYRFKDASEQSSPCCVQFVIRYRERKLKIGRVYRVEILGATRIVLWWRLWTPWVNFLTYSWKRKELVNPFPVDSGFPVHPFRSSRSWSAA